MNSPTVQALDVLLEARVSSYELLFCKYSCHAHDGSPADLGQGM